VPRNRRVAETTPWPLTVAFAAALVAFAFALQFTTPHLGSIDGYFHIRYSAHLAAAGWRGFPPRFPWLPLTILSEDRYFDHHWLFHLGLIPFARGDLILGAKLAAAAGAALVFVAAYALLRWLGVRRAEWWTVALLAAAPGFLYRMEMPRVQAWSLLFQFGAFALLVRERHRWLLPLAWVYTWLYNAFPFLIAMCACATAAHWLATRRVVWQPPVVAAAGAAAGLLVNPYFPRNVQFILTHYLAKLHVSADVPVGAEWYPLPVAEWFGWGGLVSLLAAAAALLYRMRAELDAARWLAVLVAGMYFALLWKSSRFLEYCVPFGALALALTAHRPLDARVRSWRLPARRRLAAALLAWLAVSTGFAIRQLRGRPPVTRYAGAARWIRAHTPPGSLVFTSDWDDFPLLYFHNPDNAYVVGLDPTYLAERDSGLYHQWRRIAAGEETQPAARLRSDFDAAVAFTGREQTAFIDAMEGDPQARRVYEDAEAVVYALDGGSS
jgi:hypothetical protein